jgi:uncharacterized protein YqcC (DUF446 family)
VCRAVRRLFSRTTFAQAIFKPGQLKPEASSFRSTAPYKIKTMILKALAKIIALPHLYAYVRSPVNLIFTELNKALANGLLKIDQPFRALYAPHSPAMRISALFLGC